jgi:hypothetical protein
MIKSLAALAIFAVLGTSVIALPGFAPRVQAGEAAVLAKADRLTIHPVTRHCSNQNWPNIDAACLRYAASNATVHDARLVTARR